VKLDETDKMPGWKFSEYEMKGVPLRLEIGPKDLEQNQVVLVRRDTREKIAVAFDQLEAKIQELLDDIHNSMLESARKDMVARTTDARTMDEIKDVLDNKAGFVRAMWCGDTACEEKIKEDTGASSRCIPFKQEHISDTCVCCGKKAKELVYWGRAY
jgi:prolyl-tRNA synthetase